MIKLKSLLTEQEATMKLGEYSNLQKVLSEWAKTHGLLKYKKIDHGDQPDVADMKSGMQTFTYKVTHTAYIDLNAYSAKIGASVATGAQNGSITLKPEGMVGKPIIIFKLRITIFHCFAKNT